jgi:dihydroneopterin aldolase
VDIWLPDVQPWPFADYVLVHKAVLNVFEQPGQLLETFVFNIHNSIKEVIPVAEKIKVAVRKLHPPMHGSVDYAQVCYETPNP